jgi:mono/diheme cytochrome c family protein
MLRTRIGVVLLTLSNACSFADAPEVPTAASTPLAPGPVPIGPPVPPALTVAQGAAAQQVVVDHRLVARPKWLVQSDGTPIASQGALVTFPGGLSVSQDGARALVSDPERSQLYTVDLDARSVQTLSLDADAEPGRSVPGADGSFYVVGRRSGEVLLVNAVDGTITTRAHVCAAPQGLAYDSEAALLRVVCRSGALLTLDALSLELRSSVRLDPDLRDIVPLGEHFLVTRFRSAELLLIDAQGQVLERRPAMGTGCSSATAAYRAVAVGDGSVFVVHQRASDEVVSGSSAVYYESGCEGPVVVPAWTRVRLNDVDAMGELLPAPRLSLEASQQIYLAAGALDLALSPVSSRVALLAEAGAYGADVVLQVEDLVASNDEFTSAQGWGTDADPVAVAFDSDGDWFYFSREPAALHFEDGEVLALSDESRASTGQGMFHMAPTNISCAACHPEGEEDGHTWAFVFGLRRTQSLGGGILSQSPYHWDGSLADFRALTDEVFTRRMSLGLNVPDSYVEALAGWVDTIPVPAHADVDEPQAVTRGQQLFVDDVVGCAKCHSGAAFTDNQAHDVGTGQALVTPTLLGIGLRSPLMHDGCASDLPARFGACGGGDEHGVTSGLSEAQVADLIAYLVTL